MRTIYHLARMTVLFTSLVVSSVSAEPLYSVTIPFFSNALDIETGESFHDPTVLVVVCGPEDAVDTIVTPAVAGYLDFTPYPSTDLHFEYDPLADMPLLFELESSLQLTLVENSFDFSSIDTLEFQEYHAGESMTATPEQLLVMKSDALDIFTMEFIHRGGLALDIQVERLPYEPSQVPEPTSAILIGLGLLGLLGLARRKRKTQRLIRTSLFPLLLLIAITMLGAPAFAQDYALVTVQKSGDGLGTVLAGEQQCGPGCPAMSVPYAEGSAFVFKTIPEDGSRFAGWRKADGTPSQGRLHVQPGETVIAVFERETPLEGSPYVEHQLLVKLRSGAGAAELDTIHTQIGVSAVEPLDLPGVELWKIEQSVAEALAQIQDSPLFDYVEPDYIVHATATMPNDPYFSRLWGLHNIGQYGGRTDADIDAPEAWDIQRGGNVVVAVIDTGVDYNHPDLRANMWRNPGEIAGNGRDDDGNGYVDDLYGYDFANNDSNPFDDHGHGTHCAGTIGGVGNNGLGVAGVNWSVKIMALKFLSGIGSGAISDAVRAVRYATRMGVKISSNSWGGGGYSRTLDDAIRAAENAGALFIAAAGNSNLNTDTFPHYPSSYNRANIISVASTDRSDNRSSFSNYGARSVDLGAPGSAIYSTLPNNRYAYFSGTSMATPHVAGAASLLWAADPALSASAIKNILLDTVDPLVALQGKTVTGGRVNLFKAVRAIAQPALPDMNLRHGSTDVPIGYIHDIGLVGSATHRFVIQNFGDASLSLTGSPRVRVSGSSAFSVSRQPATSTIAPGAEAFFDIDFTPAAAGSYTATVSIANNDPDENPYIFTIKGAGRLPYPTAISATDGSFADRVRISWSRVAGAAYYRVYRGTSYWPQQAAPLGNWQTGLSYDDFSAVPGQEYYYWVKAAQNASGSYESWYSPYDKGHRANIAAKPDLALTALSVDSYTANSISYSYTIKNIGSAPANLDGPTGANHDNVSVQAYLSADTIFHNNGDQPAGGTILGLSPLGMLAPGETFSGTFSSGADMDLTSLPYLTMMVDWKQDCDESDEANNTRAVLIPVVETPKADLILSGLSVDSYTSDSISYRYTVRNIGNAPADLRQVSVQAYLSVDTVFNNSGDTPAGGRVLTTSSYMLAPGASYSGSFASSAAIDLSERPYLTMMVDWWKRIDESNENNNTRAVSIR